MLSIFDGIRELNEWAVPVRLLLAVVLGGLIGLEHSAKNRPAGFRTHILVCLGTAVATLTGLFLMVNLNLPIDVSRISASAISGLGFIVAGTIVVTKSMNIKGLTTAAGLWTTGVIGIAVGSGYYEIDILCAAMVLLTETLMEKIRYRIRKSPRYKVELLYSEKDALDNALRRMKDDRFAITNLKIQSLEDHPAARYMALVDLRGRAKTENLLDKIRQIDGIVNAALI